jgi:hypothetical protein
MQAITISIGKKGIEYFTDTIVANKSVVSLDTMVPPDRVIPVQSIYKTTSSTTMGVVLITQKSWTKIIIKLTQGKLGNFHANYKGVDQLLKEFNITFEVTDFYVDYNWHESYTYIKDTTNSYEEKDETNDFPSYQPTFDNLKIDAVLKFIYNVDQNVYVLTCDKTINTPKVNDANIPKDSVIQKENSKCFSTEVTEATAEMIADIDFSGQIDQIFPPIFDSIAASGKLTENIIYNFSLAMGTGENGLQFPNNSDSPVDAGEDGNGITIGVTGGVKWIDGVGVAHDYEGEEQVLPVPRVPLNADEQYMNIYISNYEINALFWAYWKDGQLDQKVTPNDLPDPGMLNTETYKIEIPAFKEYDEAPMYAYITPLMAPLNHFQTVYEFDASAMAKLETSLPIDQFNIVKKKLEGKIYISIESLDEKLDNYDFTPAERVIIKEDSSKKGMVTDQKVKYRIVIQDQEKDYPYILFNVKMQNVLTDLGLGILDLTDSNLKTLSTNKVPQSVIEKLHTLKGQKYNSADKLLEAIELKIGKDETDNFGDLILGEAVSLVQTMTFEFKAILSSAEFVETTVPDFTKASDFGFLWTSIGRPRYAETMKKLGGIGVPIPIMKDFQFLFEDSHLVPEDEYVSISTKVKYNS